MAAGRLHRLRLFAILNKLAPDFLNAAESNKSIALLSIAVKKPPFRNKILYNIMLLVQLLSKLCLSRARQ